VEKHLTKYTEINYTLKSMILKTRERALTIIFTLSSMLNAYPNLKRRRLYNMRIPSLLFLHWKAIKNWHDAKQTQWWTIKDCINTFINLVKISTILKWHFNIQLISGSTVLRKLTVTNYSINFSTARRLVRTSYMNNKFIHWRTTNIIEIKRDYINYLSTLLTIWS
jgi:hypothetical protein